MSELPTAADYVAQMKKAIDEAIRPYLDPDVPALLDEIKALRIALEPFSDAAERADIQGLADRSQVWNNITVGDLRRARTTRGND